MRDEDLVTSYSVLWVKFKHTWVCLVQKQCLVFFQVRRSTTVSWLQNQQMKVLCTNLSGEASSAIYNPKAWTVASELPIQLRENNPRTVVHSFLLLLFPWSDLPPSIERSQWERGNLGIVRAKEQGPRAFEMTQDVSNVSQKIPSPGITQQVMRETACSHPPRVPRAWICLREPTSSSDHSPWDPGHQTFLLGQRTQYHTQHIAQTAMTLPLDEGPKDKVKGLEHLLRAQPLPLVHQQQV